MRNIDFQPLDRPVSVLGFGTASLGSRVSAGEGRRALEAAWDEGVTWYDTAPPYGDGEAEAILATFLKRHRDDLVIAGKVGIPRPSRASVSRRILRWGARFAVGTLPSLRARISRARSVPARKPITADMIESSVVESLRQLSVDRLDVLGLHDPSIAEVSDPAIIGELRRMVQKGYARCISIAGSASACVSAGIASDVLQFPASVFDGAVARVRSGLPANAPTALITHSALGSGALPRLVEWPSDIRKPGATSLPVLGTRDRCRRRGPVALRPCCERFRTASGLYGFGRSPQGQLPYRRDPARSRIHPGAGKACQARCR